MATGFTGFQLTLQYQNQTRDSIVFPRHLNHLSCSHPTAILYDISLNSSSKLKYFEQNCRENQNTHIMFNFFFPPKIVRLHTNGRARQATDDNTSTRMRLAREITKAIDTHSACVILIACPL